MINENSNTTIIILIKNTILNNLSLFLLFTNIGKLIQYEKFILRSLVITGIIKAGAISSLINTSMQIFLTEYRVLYIKVIISMLIICYSSTNTLSIEIMFSFSSTVNLAITFPSLSHLIPWRSSYVTEIASASILADMIFSSGRTKSSTPYCCSYHKFNYVFRRIIIDSLILGPDSLTIYFHSFRLAKISTFLIKAV